MVEVKYTPSEADLMKRAFAFYEANRGRVPKDEKKDPVVIREVIKFLHDKGVLGGARQHELMYSIFKKLDKLAGKPVKTREELDREEEEKARLKALAEKEKKRQEAQKKLEEQQKKIEEEMKKAAELKKKQRELDKANAVVKKNEKPALDIDEILDAL